MHKNAYIIYANKREEVLVKLKLVYEKHNMRPPHIVDGKKKGEYGDGKARPPPHRSDFFSLKRKPKAEVKKSQQGLYRIMDKVTVP
jgi:hypothetical protein